MKRIGTILLALILCMMMVSATAETTFEATVVAGTTDSITAPFGGTIETFSLREGAVLNAGDHIASVETTKVYAPADGKITAVFATPGDSMATVSQRYGSALYITPTRRYSITADIEYAYNSPSNKYINIGETVYIICTNHSNHTAVGEVTAVNGTSFTVETTSGDLLMEETVYVYRSANYSYKTRIGRGTVSRTSEIGVGGEGSLLYLHVQEGQTVSRGDLLFETVSGDLDGLYATSNEIVSGISGIIASVNVHAGSNVQKGETLLTVYPQDQLLLQIEVPEYDLVNLKEGDTVSFILGYQEHTGKSYTGKVDMISYVNGESQGEVVYKAYISFDAISDVRLGMSATVTIGTIISDEDEDEGYTLQPWETDEDPITDEEPEA